MYIITLSISNAYHFYHGVLIHYSPMFLKKHLCHDLHNQDAYDHKPLINVTTDYTEKYKMYRVYTNQ